MLLDNILFNFNFSYKITGIIGIEFMPAMFLFIIAIISNFIWMKKLKKDI